MSRISIRPENISQATRQHFTKRRSVVCGLPAVWNFSDLAANYRGESLLGKDLYCGLNKSDRFEIKV